MELWVGGNIKLVVVLMLEGRSFDHMLGFLKSPDYPIDGLEGTESNPNVDGSPVVVSNDANLAGDLTINPGSHFENVNLQIFGNKDGSGSPTMSGFVGDYAG